MANSIAFISFEQHFYEKFQFYCLSAYLKDKGFAVHYINESKFGKILQRIKQCSPDVLAYSVFNTTSDTYIEFDKVQKQTLKLKSIVGGVGATVTPEIFKDTTIDAICVGEGEKALCDYLLYGKAKNIMIDGNVELDTFLDLGQLPFPDRKIVYDEESYLKRMKYRFFISGKGCPYRCTFCYHHLLQQKFKDCGKYIRKKPVDYFVEEIAQVNKDYNPHFIMMQDDTFILDKIWLGQFCEKYKRIVRKPFGCFLRANLVDEDLVKILKDGGCTSVVWSIESGNDYFRNVVLKRDMTKKQIINAADLFHKYGIKQRVTNILGLPTEEYKHIRETVELNIRCKPAFALAGTLLPFPKTDVTQFAIDTGYLNSHYNKLSNNFSSLSILNFPYKTKVKYLKTVYLFTLFVDYPILYWHLRWAFYLIPLGFLKYLHKFTELYKSFVMYPIRPSWYDVTSIVKRYLKYFKF